MSITPTGTRADLTDRVAEEIRAVMGRRRITGAQLARELGVSTMWVSYRLRGSQEIGVNDLQRIADVLNVKVRELIPEEGSTTSRVTAYSLSDSPAPVPHAVDVRSPRSLRSRRRPVAVAA